MLGKHSIHYSEYRAFVIVCYDAMADLSSSTEFLYTGPLFSGFRSASLQKRLLNIPKSTLPVTSSCQKGSDCMPTYMMKAPPRVNFKCLSCYSRAGNTQK